MNFYSFHIGDYATHTAHLEPMEDLAFRRLLDLYYLRETALPSDVAECARLIRMRSNVADVESVLKEFFTLSNEGWVNVRCAEELGKMKDKQSKARASAYASHANRNASALQTQSERSANALQTQSEGSATNTNTNTNKKNTSAPPEGVSPKVWQDFLKTRKTKVTDTAVEGIRREAGKAGITLETALETSCERGWQSFKADWMKGESPAKHNPFAGAI